MATVTRKGTKAANVSKLSLDQVGSFLQDLPEKTKDQLSLREAVDQLYGVIKAALAKGYSYDDIAKLLAGQEIAISALTLKRYVSLSGSQTAKTKTSAHKKPRQSRKAKTVEAIAQAQPTEQPTPKPAEPAEAPAAEAKPKTRGRSSTRATKPSSRSTAAKGRKKASL
ncbi:MAG TPA: hypothetical protein V6C57_17285 [Coleofasciculaceae cyanobacterium]